MDTKCIEFEGRKNDDGYGMIGNWSAGPSMEGRMILYNLHSAEDGQYRISKFDDGELASSYLLTHKLCECPRGHHYTCRHRQMLPLMLEAGILNTHYFWDFTRKLACDINGELKSEIDAMDVIINGSPLPAGVICIGLDDPAAVHNAIADAVGEPEAKLSKPTWRRT